MSELAVGIDLGTSNSCVAIARDGAVEVIPNAYSEHTTASVVAFHEDGMVEVGNRAKANIIHDPENTIYSAKRLIGRYYFSEEVKKAQAVCAYEIVEGANHGVRVMAREEAFSLPEISAMVLREMKQIAESRLGEEVNKAVVTVPAYFNDNQRQATKDAGKIAGLEVLRILNEPTAAALAYGFGKQLNQRVAVYDLGGGTFDVSVLEIGKDIFEVLSTCGDTFLGGDDFDDRLIDLLADEFVAKEAINLRGDPHAFEKIKVAAEEAKKSLSREDEVEIRVADLIVGEDGESRSIERVIAADEYASLVQDLIMRTFKVCDEAMQQADLTTRDLDGVILVGGPTRLPMVRKAVQEYFQQEVKDDVDPDEVVAKGAAIHAASLVGSVAATDAFLLDVTPLDLRIGVAGGLAESVIEANTPVPIEQTRRFTTTRDFQESVQIKVYQGASRASKDNEMLGQFEFAGFKKARRGDVAIDVTFEIDADGIVNVTAFDPETEERASTRITLSSGLSLEELEEIIEQDKTARVQTPSEAGDADSTGDAQAAEPEEPMDPVAAEPMDPVAAEPAEELEDEGIEFGGPEDMNLTAADEPIPGLMPTHADLEIEADEPLADDDAETVLSRAAMAGLDEMEPVGADDDLQLAMDEIDEDLDAAGLLLPLDEVPALEEVPGLAGLGDPIADAEADDLPAPMESLVDVDAMTEPMGEVADADADADAMPELMDAVADADAPADAMDPIDAATLPDPVEAEPMEMVAHTAAVPEPMSPVADAADVPAMEVADAVDAAEDIDVADLGLGEDSSMDLELGDLVADLDDDVLELVDAADEADEGAETALAETRPSFETASNGPSDSEEIAVTDTGSARDDDSDGGNGSQQVDVQVEPEAQTVVHPDDLYEPQIEADPSQKEALFDTNMVDLSSDDEVK